MKIQKMQVARGGSLIGTLGIMVTKMMLGASIHRGLSNLDASLFGRDEIGGRKRLFTHLANYKIVISDGKHVPPGV